MVTVIAGRKFCVESSKRRVTDLRFLIYVKIVFSHFPFPAFPAFPSALCSWILLPATRISFSRWPGLTRRTVESRQTRWTGWTGWAWWTRWSRWTRWTTYWTWWTGTVASEHAYSAHNNSTIVYALDVRNLLPLCTNRKSNSMAVPVKNVDYISVARHLRCQGNTHGPLWANMTLYARNVHPRPA